VQGGKVAIDGTYFAKRFTYHSPGQRRTLVRMLVREVVYGVTKVIIIVIQTFYRATGESGGKLWSVV